MTETTKHTYVMTAPARMLYPQRLITAEAYTETKNGVKKAKGEPKFSVDFLLPKDHPDAAGIRKAIIDCAVAKWGSAGGLTAIPMRDGDKLLKEEKNNDYYKDNFVVKSASLYQPKLAAVVNGQLTDLDSDDQKKTVGTKVFYSGSNGLGEFNFVATEIKQPDGHICKYVTAYIQKAVGLGTGERIKGAGGSASGTFAHVVGHVSMVDPRGAVDDDLPL